MNVCQMEGWVREQRNKCVSSSVNTSSWAPTMCQALHWVVNWLNKHRNNGGINANLQDGSQG